MQVGQMYVEPDGIDGRESVIELLGETHGEEYSVLHTREWTIPRDRRKVRPGETLVSKQRLTGWDAGRKTGW